MFLTFGGASSIPGGKTGETSINIRANKAYVLNYPYVTKIYTMLFNENIISIL